MRLEGKVALVTGASRGIGKEIARKFSMEGAKIAINYNESEIEAIKLEKEIHSFGRKAIIAKANMASSSEIKSMVAQVVKEFGNIDILVNNAGLLITKDFFDTTEEDWDSVIDTNLRGPYLCTREVAPLMLKRDGKSKIVNISSISGLTGQVSALNFVHYVASKAGMIGLTRALAVRLAPKINVNAIAPGVVETELTSFFTPEKRAKLLEETPLKRFGLPKDIADAALFLASDESDWITGEVLTVSGGRGMR
jgi:3-oxoacyl-[acyl-carrier protein] reductase